MFELTLRDTKTDRSVTFTYDIRGDVVTTISPDPKQELPSVFGIYELDDIESFLKDMIDEMERFYDGH